MDGMAARLLSELPTSEIPAGTILDSPITERRPDMSS
jgi:hypothetical protein